MSVNAFEANAMDDWIHFHFDAMGRSTRRDANQTEDIVYVCHATSAWSMDEWMD